MQAAKGCVSYCGSRSRGFSKTRVSEGPVRRLIRRPSARGRACRLRSDGAGCGSWRRRSWRRIWCGRRRKPRWETSCSAQTSLKRTTRNCASSCSRYGPEAL
eukprot:8877915-Pyramimonas_sp.AAC.2